jgi:hypothetical protein
METSFCLSRKNLYKDFATPFITQSCKLFNVSKNIKESSYYLWPIKIIEELEKDYIFTNPAEIREFLLNSKDLISILQEAPEQIYRIFGLVPICLELHHDPEEGWDELFIVIKSSYPTEKAFELEKKLFDEWFIHIMDKIGNKLNFTEEPL